MIRSNIRERNILFLCDDNACLSFIAEAIAQRLSPPSTLVFSAGLEPSKINSQTKEVLSEIGVNVSTENGKGLDRIPTHDIDLIINLGKQTEALPGFSAKAKWRTWKISDPRRDPGATLDTFRRLRDEINVRVAGLFLDYWRNPA